MHGHLQRLADEAGISLYSLAVEAGLNQQTLYRMKLRNSMGTPETLNALCRVLGSRLGRKPSEVYAELTGIDEPVGEVVS